MEIKLKEKLIPRNGKGDPEFKLLGGHPEYNPTHSMPDTVLGVFSEDEVIELVNRALYQIEYQRESHKKRGQIERDKAKAIKQGLKAAGIDVKALQVQNELKGEK